MDDLDRDPRGRILALYNPWSGTLERHPEVLDPLLERLGEAAARKVHTPEDVTDAVRDLRPGPEDALCVIGGDGTIQATLTALDSWRSEGPWPTLVAVGAGTTNMTAKDLGATGSLPEQIDVLLEWLRAGVEEDGLRVTRPLLRVDRPDGSTLCGAFFGVGVICEGVRFFRERLRGGPLTGSVTSLVSVVRMLGSLAAGDPEKAGALRVEWRLDGEPPAKGVVTFCLATTLDRLILGSRPYWGSEDAPIHYTAVEREARGFWTGLPRLARGDPGGRLTPERGWTSRNVDRMELRFDGPFVIDGELFEAEASAGPLSLTSPRVVEWLVPG